MHSHIKLGSCLYIALYRYKLIIEKRVTILLVYCFIYLKYYLCIVIGC